MSQPVLRKPWLYGLLHNSNSLDEVLKSFFGFQGEWPPIPDPSLHDRLENASNRLFGFLYAQAHQNEHVVDGSQRREPGFHLAAWDLADEALHEVAVACLLARFGAIPQGIVHIRRSMEVAIDAVFLSTTAVERDREPWNPFSDLYVSGLWECYASKSRVLGATEAIQAIRSAGGDVRRELKDFTTCCLTRFASRYCAVHFEALVREHARNRLPRPVFSETRTGTCVRPECRNPVAYALFDRVPTLQLLREVAKAVVGGARGTKTFDAAFQTLYDRTSRFVHVTREAHGHEPGFTEKAVNEWADTTSLLTAWMSRVFRVLWRHLRLDRPGLSEWMDRVGHDYSVVDWSQPEEKLSVCRLTDGAVP